MIQTKECPNCGNEHRLHIKKCGCGHVFEFKTESAQPTFSKEEIERRYDERVRRQMAEFSGTPSEEFEASRPSKDWARRILVRLRDGEFVPLIAEEMAKEALRLP